MRVSVTDKLDVTSTKPVKGGKYLAVRANVSRSGVYQYARKEIGLTDGDPNELVGVYRSPEFTFDEASLATIAHIPVTKNHPAKGVSAKTWKRDAIGHVGNAVWENEDRKHVMVDMLLMDEDGISAAQSTHRQISLGYETSIRLDRGVSPEGEPYEAVMEGGYIADHAALVPLGRAGHTCRIGDAAWPVEDSPEQPQKENRTVKTILVDSVPFNQDNLDGLEAAVKKVEDRAANAETALADAQTKAATDAVALADAQAQVATLTAEKATLTAELADARDPAKLRDAAAEYAAIADKARKLGVEVADADSVATIKANAVKAKVGDAAASFTDAQFDAAFATLSVPTDAKPDAFRQSMAARDSVSIGDAMAESQRAYAEKIAALAA